MTQKNFELEKFRIENWLRKCQIEIDNRFLRRHVEQTHQDFQSPKFQNIGWNKVAVAEMDMQKQ